MTDLADRLFALWIEPIEGRSDVYADFLAVYTDPVVVNGTSVALPALIDRGRMLQAALRDVERELLDVVEAPDRLAIAFVLRGTHLGVYESPAGPVQPTGRRVEFRALDILQVEHGRVAGIWVVPDELGLLQQLDAVSLR
jgi:predicted ester cyclase